MKYVYVKALTDAAALANGGEKAGDKVEIAVLSFNPLLFERIGNQDKIDKGQDLHEGPQEVEKAAEAPPVEPVGTMVVDGQIVLQSDFEATNLPKKAINSPKKQPAATAPKPPANEE